MGKFLGFLNGIVSGLRFRLLLLVLLACTPLIVLTLHTAWEDRRRQMEAWQQRSQRMILLASREEEKLIDQTRQLLLFTADSEAVRSGNRRDCKKLLDELFKGYPRYANLGVVKTNGEVLASAVPTAGVASRNDHEFFQRALATGDFIVGDFPVARLNSKHSINFGYPVFDASGQLDGVVFAALDLDWFSRSGSELPSQLPKGATWTEIDSKGTVIVRYPADPQSVGQPLPEQSLLKTVFDSQRGVVKGLDRDGVPTFYAFASIQSQFVPGNLVAILGIPTQNLFAAADRTQFRNLIWLGIAGSLALALGWFGSNLLVLRPVKALVNSSARLASGDLSARTGLPHGRDELGRLTLTFDLMAQALEQRELERKNASNKLLLLSHRLVEVQETERRHIARELHDEIGQSLTVAEMNLQAALRSPLAAARERRLEESIKAVERVLEQVHDLSLNLRPSMLDDLGLEPALRWYAHRQAAVAGLGVELRIEPLEDRIDPVVETECFRVAQEALTNVTRHAKARNIVLELGKKDGELHLSVRDDGIGFDVASVRHRAVRGASLGILSMEERASLVGGGIQYNSAPGHGTEIHAWFPLKRRLVEV